MNIHLSYMQKEDIDGVCEVENSSFNIPWTKEAFINELYNELAVYVVAKMGQKVVGYVGMWHICNECHINNIAVLPEYRKKGIGNKLLEFLIGYCNDNAIFGVTLEVRVGNKVAQEFYKKYGFEIEGIRKGYYVDTKEDALIMWKRIA